MLHLKNVRPLQRYGLNSLHHMIQRWGLEPQRKCRFLEFNYIYCECCVHYMVIAHQGGCLELTFSNIGLFVKRTTKSC